MDMKNKLNAKPFKAINDNKVVEAVTKKSWFSCTRFVTCCNSAKISESELHDQTSKEGDVKNVPVGIMKAVGEVNGS